MHCTERRPKILALVLVAMMAMGMVSALADDVLKNNAATVLTTPGTTATIPLAKSFIADNDIAKVGEASVMINTPGITYSYTITGIDSDKKVTGKSGREESGTATTVEVKAGPLSAITNGVTVSGESATLSIAIPAKELTLNAQGQQIATGKTDLTFTAANFGAPGIYRYKITEADTNDNARKTQGIVKGQTTGDYFLDVYVGYVSADAAKTTDNLRINGYVLVREDADINADKDGNKIVTTQEETNMVEKESSIGTKDIVTEDPGTPGTPGDPTDDVLSGNTEYTTANADMYYTYNVKLKKEVAGTMGDTSFEFKFDATIDNANLKYSVSGPFGTGSNNNETTSYSGLGTLATYNLKHADEITIIGLSPKATVKYQETNETESTYTVTAKDGSQADITLAYSNTNLAATKQAAKGDTVEAYKTVAAKVSNYSDTAVATEKYTADEKTASTVYTNTLNDISPTGLVLRFAPYFAMFAAGVALFIILGIKRRKNEED